MSWYIYNLSYIFFIVQLINWTLFLTPKFSTISWRRGPPRLTFFLIELQKQFWKALIRLFGAFKYPKDQNHHLIWKKRYRRIGCFVYATKILLWQTNWLRGLSVGLVFEILLPFTFYFVYHWHKRIVKPVAGFIFIFLWLKTNKRTGVGAQHQPPHTPFLQA